MIITIGALLMLISCTTQPPTDLTGENIIPKPVSVTATGDYFCLGPKAVIYIQDHSGEVSAIGNYLSSVLKPATGFNLDVKPTDEIPGKGNILLTLSGAG